MQKSEQTGTGFRSKAAGDFGGKRHLISLQSDTRFRRFRHPWSALASLLSGK